MRTRKGITDDIADGDHLLDKVLAQTRDGECDKLLDFMEQASCARGKRGRKQ